MKINLKALVLDYEGKPIKPADSEEPIRYFEVFNQALNGNIPGEMLTAEVKSKIYQLTMKIYKEKDKEPNFTPEQLTLVKERVGKSYAPIIYGRICDLIDGTGEPEADKAVANKDLPPEKSTAN